MHPTSGPIGTPYGASGSHWSGGIHKGVDFPVPHGTSVVAAWSGVVQSVSWGSAFGIHVVIDHDDLPGGQPGLWAGYAHLSRSLVRAGQRVAAGELIGRSGATGNVTGDHLHFEVQRARSWSATGHTNPAPWLAARPGGAAGVYLTKLHYGQRDSDSVRALQRALRTHIAGGLPVTGDYLDGTDDAVRACQRMHGFGADAARHSFVGEQQAHHLGLHVVG